MNFPETNKEFSVKFNEEMQVNTGNGQGADGFSPIAKVEETAEGANITITDKNGTTTAAIKNGKDGYTPQKNVDYFDGKDGKDGLNGADGKDGKDGKAIRIDEEGYIICSSPITDKKAGSLWALIQKMSFVEQPTMEELDSFKSAWGITPKALYPLANGTHTFSDGTVVKTTNGNHIKVAFGSEVENVTIVLSNVGENGSELTNSNALNPETTWFALKQNDMIKAEYSNFELNSSASNVAIGFKHTGTPNSVAGLSATYPTTAVEQTMTEGANVGNMFLYVSGAKAGDTLDFYVSITVNDIKYV